MSSIGRTSVILSDPQALDRLFSQLKTEEQQRLGFPVERKWNRLTLNYLGPTLDPPYYLLIQNDQIDVNFHRKVLEQDPEDQFYFRRAHKIGEGKGIIDLKTYDKITFWLFQDDSPEPILSDIPIEIEYLWEWSDRPVGPRFENLTDKFLADEISFEDWMYEMMYENSSEVN